MGSWFSNLSVRRNETVTEDALAQYICQWMAQRQYSSVPSAEEADASFAILSPNDSSWTSVYSDIFGFEDPKSFTELAGSMSEAIRSDVLGIACFDSDYLYLNLIDAAGGIDAWVGAGSVAGLGIKRRTNLSAWQNKVVDYSHFRESVRKKYVCAEEILAEIAPCLGLPEQYSSLSYEYLEALAPGENIRYLHFKLPDSMKTEEPPRLIAGLTSLMPCFLEKPHTVSALNAGGASKGLSVYFLGSYVEREEITFSDVCFVKLRNNRPNSTPIELRKIQLSNGQWAYYYHDPDYKLPPKVDDRLPLRKRLQVAFEREITVRFVPHGNPRKILDITVALVPDKNPERGRVWNLLQYYGSKERFIADYNKRWQSSPNCQVDLLCEEDFD